MKKILYKEIFAKHDTEQPVSDVLIHGENGDVAISIKKYLTLSERSSLVKDIASIVCRNDENGNMIYAPYLYQFSVDYCIANYFTNITMPKNPDEAWFFIKNAKILQIVRNECGDEYIDDILKDASHMIEYQKLCSVKDKNIEYLYDSLNDILKTLNEKIMELDSNDIVNTFLPVKDVFTDSNNPVDIDIVN